MLSPKSLRMKTLAKDFVSLGCRCIVVWTIIFVTTVNSQMATASPLIVLSSSLSEGQQVCPRDKLIFTCVTNGSSTLAWSNDEYIGQGQGDNLLNLPSYEKQGYIARNDASVMGTKATLIRKEIQENETQGILESELEICVISEYQIATINCLHVDNDSQESTRFQLLDEPGVPQNVIIEQVPDSDNNDNMCTLDVQLDHPNNANPLNFNRYSYRVDYPADSLYISGTTSPSPLTGRIRMPAAHCTQDLRINVTALVCGDRVGAMAIGIKPKLLEPIGLPTDVTAIVGLTISLVCLVIVAIAISISISVFVLCKKKTSKGRGHSKLRTDESYPMKMAAGHEEHHKQPKFDSVPVYMDPGAREATSGTGELFADVQLDKPSKGKTQPQKSTPDFAYSTLMQVPSDEPTPKTSLSANLPEDIKELIKKEVQKVLSQMTAKLPGIQEQDEKAKLLGNNGIASEGTN